LTFQVEKGKIWGLLGPNAAGKTTTMRILTGYLPATEGKAKVAGFDVFDKPNEVKKVIGYLPETLPLYNEMTVTSYLNFVAELKQVPSSKKQAAVDRAIKVTGLEPVAKRLIKNISRGFKQRVGIAQALIHDPQVLILDEPTIGLDPAQIVEIRSLIKSLKGEHTIMLSTHILAEVTQVCDGVVIINEGRLMASGSLEQLSTSFQKKEGVALKVKKMEEAQLELSRFLGVEKVFKQNGELQVEWSPGKDLREEIARLVIERGYGLIEMRSLAMSLEELYLKIVSGGANQ
ncbi:MAG: ABC transporter ATP-binding protein, partial [Candidatus Aminicenantes bacterium]|nr:ABC transporter ATP-binding protein [Candidatus Aminicenantes bacterium]